LCFLPAKVAHARATTGTRQDSPWSPTIGRLALATGAQVLPAFIEGKNSSLFYAAGHLHPALRTALLARELLKKRDASVTVRLGQPIAARELGQTSVDAARATLSIRSAVETLGRSGTTRSAGLKSSRFAQTGEARCHSV
jgi:putative hemolysin